MPFDQSIYSLFPQINEQYGYEPADIQLLLQYKINGRDKISLDANTKAIQITPFHDGRLLEQFKAISTSSISDSETTGLIVVIPYRIIDSHWVGILLNFEPNEDVPHGKFISSLLADSDLHEQEEIFYTEVNKIFLDVFFGGSDENQQNSIAKITDLMSDDEHSSGVYVVENLYRACFDLTTKTHPTTKGFRTLHAEEVLNNNPARATKFYKIPNSYSEATFLKPSQDYSYSYEDAKRILQARITMELKDSAQMFRKPVFVMDDMIEGRSHSLYDVLLSEKKLRKGPRILLIPRYLDSEKSKSKLRYWAGLALEIDDKNNVKVILFNSYTPTNRYINHDIKEFVSQIKKAYPHCTIRRNSDEMQTDQIVNSAIFMIENFLMCAQERYGTTIDVSRSRVKDLMSLLKHDPLFFDEFYDRQLNGKFAKSKSVIPCEDIDQFYLYSPETIELVLNSRINTFELLRTKYFKADISAVYSREEGQLINIIREHIANKKNSKSKSSVLSICHPLCIDHWVGLLIWIDEEHEIKHVELVSSLVANSSKLKDEQSFFVKLKENLMSMIGIDADKFENCSQGLFDTIHGPSISDEWSSGVCVIENICSSLYGIKKSSEQDLKSIRAIHSEYARKINPSLYKDFYRETTKQHKNLDEKPHVPHDVDFFLKRLTSLEYNSKIIFDKTAKNCEVIVAANLEENYETLFDQDSKCFKLVITEKSKLNGVTRVFATKSLGNSFSKYMSTYGLSMGLGLFGGGVGGVVFGAALGLAIGELIIAEALILVSPMVLAIPGLAFGLAGAGIMGTRTYFSRNFSATIKQAINLYNESDNTQNDSKLKKAEQKLEEEFGGNEKIPGRPFFYRSLRYLSTKTAQKCLALLTLANIKAKLEDEKCIAVYRRLYKCTSNKKFKLLSLLGELKLWSQADWFTEFNMQKITSEERDSNIERIASLLNSEYKYIIEYYFNQVWKTYELMLTILANHSCLASYEGFEKVKPAITSIQSCNDLHCLRYFETDSNGKLAEVMFNFAQGISYILVGIHHTYMSKEARNKNDKKIETSEACKQHLQANDKFILVNKLIKQFGLDVHFKDGTHGHHVLTAINSCIVRHQQRSVEGEDLNAEVANEYGNENAISEFIRPATPILFRNGSIANAWRNTQNCEEQIDMVRQFHNCHQMN